MTTARKKTATRTETAARAMTTVSQKKGTRRRRPEPGTANIFGADPHKTTLTATVLDCRGGVLGTSVFRVSGDGHRAMEAWASSFGAIERWGIEGASGLGRHTAMYLARAGHDVRDCSPNRTNERRRARQQGKSDASDSLRIARETQADPGMPRAFKRAEGDAGPDETTECLQLWHKARRSLLKSRQHLLNEAESLLVELPEALRDALPDTSEVRARLEALAGRDRSVALDRPTQLRLRLLEDHARAVAELDDKEKEATAELAELTKAAGSTLDELCGISTRSAAELLVEVGDPRRFTGGGFARFNGTAPLPASSGEGDEGPRRHRLNRGGNRRVNAVLYRMAITQLRCDPRAQRIYEEARQRGHTKKEARRVLKRHLSDVVYRRMIVDCNALPPPRRTPRPGGPHDA
ncbi:MAG: IS110 family transposase [Acidimicrobiales bacterium]